MRRNFKQTTKFDYEVGPWPSYTELISEAIRTQKETTILMKEGRIDKEEAGHRITNATQVILFARAAIERESAKVRQMRNEPTIQREP